jgi:hypothetical protein
MGEGRGGRKEIDERFLFVELLLSYEGGWWGILPWLGLAAQTADCSRADVRCCKFNWFSEFDRIIYTLIRFAIWLKIRLSAS